MYRTSRLTQVGADSGGLSLLRLCFLQMIWFLWPPRAVIFSSHWDSMQSNRAKMEKNKLLDDWSIVYVPMLYQSVFLP